MSTENRTNDKEDKHHLESHLKLGYPGPTVRLGNYSSVNSLRSLKISWLFLVDIPINLTTWSILLICGRKDAPTTADDIPAASSDHVLPSIWRRLRSHKFGHGQRSEVTWAAGHQTPGTPRTRERRSSDAAVSSEDRGAASDSAACSREETVIMWNTKHTNILIGHIVHRERGVIITCWL